MTTKNTTWSQLPQRLQDAITVCAPNLANMLTAAEKAANDRDSDNSPEPLIDARKRKVTLTRDTPAIHVEPGMEVVSCGVAHKVTGVEVTEHLARIQLADAPNARGGTYLCAPDDDVTIITGRATIIPDAPSDPEDAESTSTGIRMDHLQRIMEALARHSIDSTFEGSNDGTGTLAIQYDPRNPQGLAAALSILDRETDGADYTTITYFPLERAARPSLRTAKAVIDNTPITIRWDEQ